MNNSCPYTLSDFDYNLPPELIAQEALAERDSSRLLAVRRDSPPVLGAWEHRYFRDLPAYLKSGDVLVLNDTKVIPARFWARRVGSAGWPPLRMEILLLRAKNNNGCWEALMRPAKRARMGETLQAGAVPIKILHKDPAGKAILEFPADLNVNRFLEAEGVAPLPPYIKRPKVGAMPLREEDLQRYQTVYAQKDGAVAAPTAGLHFTPALLKEIENKGVQIVYITLHVGWGTFKPVKVNILEEHRMEAEYYYIDEKTAATINQAKQESRRVISVGTTTVRTLETAARNSGFIKGQSGESTLFIYPPYQFKVVDAMITNFHLPQSTLLMLVSAFAGRDLIMAVYQEAIREKYRFYSYGDAMIIL